MRSTLFLLFALLAPVSSLGADVRVSYLVDAKALDKNAPAGTPLTFELFSDAACLSSVASQIVNVEAVDVRAQVKALKTAGGPPAPKPAELRHVLTGVASDPVLYLQVSGPGILPVGPACQLQHASVGGSATIEAPQPLPYEAGFSDYGFAYDLGTFYKDAERVYLQGLVLVSGPFSGVIATLPVGYRPAARLMTVANRNEGTCRIDITATGEVTVMLCTGSGSFLSLTGISFRVP